MWFSARILYWKTIKNNNERLLWCHIIYYWNMIKQRSKQKQSMHLVSLFLSRLSPPNKSHRARHRYQNPRHWKSRIRCQLQHRCALHHQDVQSLYASFCWISKQVGMAIHTWHHRSHQIRIFRARGSNRSARQPSNGRHCHDRERWKFPAQHW